MAGFLAHGVGLAFVFRHAGVDLSLMTVSIWRGSVGGHRSYWTISRRIGARKTLGSGWLLPLEAPSPPSTLTVGRAVAMMTDCGYQRTEGVRCSLTLIFKLSKSTSTTMWDTIM